MLPLEKWDIDNSDTIEIQNNIQLEKKDIKDLFEEKSISLPAIFIPVTEHVNQSIQHYVRNKADLTANQKDCYGFLGDMFEHYLDHAKETKFLVMPIVASIPDDILSSPGAEDAVTTIIYGISSAVGFMLPRLEELLFISTSIVSEGEPDMNTAQKNLITMVLDIRKKKVTKLVALPFSGNKAPLYWLVDKKYIPKDSEEEIDEAKLQLTNKIFDGLLAGNMLIIEDSIKHYEGEKNENNKKS